MDLLHPKIRGICYRDFLILAGLIIALVGSITFWTGGIADPYSRFGVIEIERVYVETFQDFWNITVKMKNIGTKRAVIETITFRSGNISYSFDSSISIDSGAQREVFFTLTHADFIPDTEVEMWIQTIEGGKYTSNILLQYYDH
jgi:hypothetical protein